MKRFAITLLCIFTCLSLDAQVSPEVITFPSDYRLYYDSNLASSYVEAFGIQRKFSNIDFEKFFAKWEGWSELVAKGTVSNEYNEIFKKHFCKTNPQAKDKSKYLTLPLYVKVIKYDYDVNLDSNTIADSDSLKQNINPEYITYFTPAIESDKKVLYISPEVKSILAGYLEEDRQSSPDEYQKRKAMIEELIPTIRAHWDNGWFFLSYPNIQEVVITNNAYYIDLVYADYEGHKFFVPWDKEPIEISIWIQ